MVSIVVVFPDLEWVFVLDSPAISSPMSKLIFQKWGATISDESNDRLFACLSVMAAIDSATALSFHHIPSWNANQTESAQNVHDTNELNISKRNVYQFQTICHLRRIV